MKTKTIALALSLSSFGLLAPAQAAPKAQQQIRNVKIANVDVPEHRVHALSGELYDMKVASQRNFARFFQKIVRGDFSGEYVFERNNKVTFFLDPADNMHPRYAQRGEDWAHGGVENIPVGKRIKFLVTPNKLHEHYGSKLDGEVSVSDAKLVYETMLEAERMAKQLGIINPRIFMNNAQTASIGQLHIHVYGERPPGFKYPTSMASLASAQ
jgi:hypothetical protein